MEKPKKGIAAMFTKKSEKTEKKKKTDKKEKTSKKQTTTKRTKGDKASTDSDEYSPEECCVCLINNSLFTSFLICSSSTS